MKQRFIPALIMIMLASLACQISPTPVPLPAPSETPTATVTLTPTLTLTPTPTETPQLSAANGPALIELHMFNPQRGWGLMENMILSTRDGGLNWAQVPLPGVKFDSSLVGTSFQSADIAYFLAPVPDTRIGQFFGTRDGGQTWLITPVPFSSGKLYFVDDNVGFVFQTLSQTSDVMTVAIYQTLDRGANWGQVFIHAADQGDTNLPATGIKTGISFIDASNGFIGLLSQENSIGLYRTTDAGRTWAKQDLNVPFGLGAYTSTVWPPVFISGNGVDGFLPVDLISKNTGASNRVFYVTHDLGVTWNMAGSIANGETYHFFDTKTGWVWSDRTVYSTHDGALTWDRLPIAFNRRERATIIEFVDPLNGWLVTVDTKNRLHMYRTADGGATWTVMFL